MQPLGAMGYVQQLATEADVKRVLGEVDPLTVARILAIAPTRDEVDEAVCSLEEEMGFGEEPRTPSSARVASVRAVIAALLTTEQELDPVQDWRGS